MFISMQDGALSDNDNLASTTDLNIEIDAHGKPSSLNPLMLMLYMCIMFLPLHAQCIWNFVVVDVVVSHTLLCVSQSYQMWNNGWN